MDDSLPAPSPSTDRLPAVLDDTMGWDPDRVRALIALDEMARRLAYIVGTEADALPAWQRSWVQRRVGVILRQEGQRTQAAQWERACALWEKARDEGGG